MTKALKQSIPLLFVLLLLSEVAGAQPAKQIQHQQLLWMRLSERININAKWSVYGEMETRRFTTPDRQQQWLLPRVAAYYKVNNTLDAGLATAVFLHVIPQKDGSDDVLRPEIRPHQEMTLTQGVGKVKFIHRYIVEERFFHKLAQDKLAPGWEFAMRFRYRIQLQLPLVDENHAIPVLFRAYEEILINAGSQIVYNVFDHNRLYAGLSFMFSPHWTTEIGYINWFQQQPSGSDFIDRHILRITLAHSFDL